MENILSKFNADNLEIRLTSEKLFINTSTSNETFALRSVNGIGVVDLVEEYNKDLTLWKSRKGANVSFYVFAVIFAFAGLSSLSWSVGFAILVLAVSGLFFWLGSIQKNIKPKMMSAVRIMMSGGNRDFQFDKTGKISGNVAEFVAKVETTLTSYHKNNG
jgi:hypothetical protein